MLNVSTNVTQRKNYGARVGTQVCPILCPTPSMVPLTDPSRALPPQGRWPGLSPDQVGGGDCLPCFTGRAGLNWLVQYSFNKHALLSLECSGPCAQYQRYGGDQGRGGPGNM